MVKTVIDNYKQISSSSDFQALNLLIFIYIHFFCVPHILINKILLRLFLNKISSDLLVTYTLVPEYFINLKHKFRKLSLLSETVKQRNKYFLLHFFLSSLLQPVYKGSEQTLRNIKQFFFYKKFFKYLVQREVVLLKLFKYSCHRLSTTSKTCSCQSSVPKENSMQWK